MSKVVDVAKGIGSKILGGGSSSGALGTGSFTGSKFDALDKSSFGQKLADDENQKAIRAQQTAQTQRLSDRATGQAPSLAEAQLKAATNRSLAQQLGAAQSARGGSSGLRERQLMKQQGQARRETAEAAAVTGIQEQQSAEQQLAQQLQAQRATDINLAESDRASAQKLQEILLNENLGVQGMNLSGFQSAAQNRGGLVKNLGSGLAAISDSTLKKNIKKEGASATKDSEKSKDKEDKESSKMMKFAKGFAGSESTSNSSDGVGTAALSRAMSKISDEDSKKNIKKDEEDFNPKSFLDALQAYSYEYKDAGKKMPEGGEGKRLSVMTQDLEKAGPVGKSMVTNTPQGKVVDYGRGFGAILAAQTHLNSRLAELEKKKKK